MTFKNIVDTIINLLEYISWILMGLALLIFLYGLTKYMLGAGDESGREESRKYIIYGVIGLFVMVSIWGLVAVLTNTFIPGSDVGLPTLSI